VHHAEEWHQKLQQLGDDYDTVLLNNPSNRIK
jgi:hypothetical protein